MMTAMSAKLSREYSWILNTDKGIRLSPKRCIEIGHALQVAEDFESLPQDVREFILSVHDDPARLR